MGRALGIIILLIVAWLAYSAYFILSMHPRFTGEWGYVDEATTEINIVMSLGKPAPFPITIENATVSLGGVSFARVERAEVGFLSSKAAFTMVIDNKKLVEALVKHIENGEVSDVSISLNVKLFNVLPLHYTIDKEVTTDILSYVENIKVEPETRVIGFIPIKTPGIEGIEARWGGVTREHIKIIANVKIYNPNAVPLPLMGLSSTIYINDVRVGEAHLLEKTVIKAGGRDTVGVEIIIDPGVLPRVWAEHVKKGERSVIRADIYMTLEVANRPFKVCLTSVEKTIETDILSSLSSI
ncbi:LEA type 2 family protein [Pyrococcus yayanosii]|uniref:LEA type 2 family protein n=1 Tax=Pyrococcus yayanosii TaxID=1008460 RepID=UPI00064FF7EB|nr:LEA type 2 family protein [Pyrococcus yayanosii]